MQALGGVLAKRSTYYTCLVGIVVASGFTDGAHHEASTCPYPMKLSYENTIVEDIRHLVMSSLDALDEEEENRMGVELEDELMQVRAENTVIRKENAVLRRRDNKERVGVVIVYFLGLIIFMLLCIIIYE